jgi:aspartate/methionine/tyrosine aminotransferase
MIASPARLAEAEKFLDTTTICAPRVGQIAALAGLRTLSNWVGGERREILSRRAALEALAPALLPNWRVAGCGAYFAWLIHPFAGSSLDLAPMIVDQCGILLLPGTMFYPAGDPLGARSFRMAFANADAHGLAEALSRLAEFAP